MAPCFTSLPMKLAMPWLLHQMAKLGMEVEVGPNVGA